MGSDTKGQVTLTSFDAGSKVELVDKKGDFYAPGKVVKSVKVGKDGSADLDGLRVGAPFWAVGKFGGRQRAVSVTAKEPVPAKPKAPRPAGGAQTRSEAGPSREIVTGPRSTVTARVRGHAAPEGEFADSRVGEPTPKDEREPDPSPFPRIEDSPKSEVLVSDTLTGEAHPVPDRELRQDEVPKGAVQESDTEAGVATIIEKPKAAKPDTKAAAAKRSAASKKAAATRKRNAKKKGGK